MLTDTIQHEVATAMQAFTDYLTDYFSKADALSQGQVARKAGIHRVNLNRIVNGHQVPSLTTAEAIAAATGSTLSKILKKSFSREAIHA